VSNATLILGESGTGKSTSLHRLDPSETFIINTIGKPLPFIGFNKKYNVESKNYIVTDDYSKILNTLLVIGRNEKYAHIKNIIIDDFQYIMANEFMRRASEKGYNKFTEIAQHAYVIIEAALSLRDDLYIFVLSHSELSDTGKMKAKTIGKMLDDKITLEGMFTTVMHSCCVDGTYKFITNFDGHHIAKSPMGMFKDMTIENDLFSVKNSMINYYTGDMQDEIHA